MPKKKQPIKRVVKQEFKPPSKEESLLFEINRANGIAIELGDVLAFNFDKGALVTTDGKKFYREN